MCGKALAVHRKCHVSQRCVFEQLGIVLQYSGQRVLPWLHSEAWSQRRFHHPQAALVCELYHKQLSTLVQHHSTCRVEAYAGALAVHFAGLGVACERRHVRALACKSCVDSCCSQR